MVRLCIALLLGVAVMAAAPAPVAAHDSGLVENLVIANRILYDQGVVDGFGHISARDAHNPEHFWLARSMAPGLVTVADIMQHDRDGEPVDPQGRTPYLERFIHSEIYKTHPQVMAIVHTHSPAVIPFGVVGTPLRPVYHMSSFLGPRVPVFEIRDAAGPATDMLIRTPALGAALAKSLGGAAVVLLRGHGNVVVGGSIEEAVFRAVYTEINARLEADALRIGQRQVRFLNDAEARLATETNRAQIRRAWDLWKAKAFAAAPLLGDKADSAIPRHDGTAGSQPPHAGPAEHR
jgi:ribulose-5-phosphate 4-epimerase/fuculose-1-phosphate aldolase